MAYYLLGKKDESRKQNAENICKTLEYLQSELNIIGFSWEEEGKYEEAYTCFRLNSDLYDLMVGEREDEMPFCLALSHTECALNCMRLNRPDEAMDWLEKMVRHEKITAKNYNVITETQLPYLFGQTKHYPANSYRRTDTLVPILTWTIFDSIRNTARFQAILADAEAFERGE
ncbi:MAG: hypothetical protein IKI93_20545 [Clostridia bacterium]|nr:hypothetical protein [Clostridia bacterium]